MKKLTEEFSIADLNHLSKEEGVFVCCDYDGTLIPFSKSPEKTVTPDRVVSVLDKLNSNPSISIAVLSGRSLPELRNLIPLHSITLAGFHGIEVNFFDGAKFTWPGSKKVRKKLKKIKTALEKEFNNTKGTILEDKEHSIALHYRAYEGKDEKIIEPFYSAVEDFRPFDKLEILEGSKILEIRPKDWHKGKALQKIRSRLTSGNPPTFYFGDDTTDEDAFRILDRKGKDFPVLVGKDEKEESAARYTLDGPDELLTFLEKLAKDI